MKFHNECAAAPLYFWLSHVTVACAADAGYALPLAVMLSSASSHIAAGSGVDAYVLDDGITAEGKSKLAASLPSNVRLHWRQAPPLKGFPLWGRMSPTTYQKLKLSDWIPESLSRVIWLDCDLLVLDDLSIMWRQDLNGRIALAAQDQRVPLVSSRFGVAGWRDLGLPPGTKYFNAGVMLIDLDKWRAHNVGDEALKYLESYRNRVYFWDQEALNAALADNWDELDMRWNWHPALDQLNGLPSQSPPRPSIVHFNGNLKPWTFAGSGRYRTLYRRYLDRTAWAGTRPARKWTDGIVERYEVSSLRRLFYPAEQWSTIALRTLTRKKSGDSVNVE